MEKELGKVDAAIGKAIDDLKAILTTLEGYDSKQLNPLKPKLFEMQSQNNRIRAKSEQIKINVDKIERILTTIE